LGWRPGRRKCGFRIIRTRGGPSKSCVRLCSIAWRQSGKARPADPASIRNPLRKSLKKLRYGIDFMRPVFRHGKQLQQTLGDINDAVVGE
jgi:CHAD domain-containing protein